MYFGERDLRATYNNTEAFKKSLKQERVKIPRPINRPTAKSFREGDLGAHSKPITAKLKKNIIVYYTIYKYHMIYINNR